MNGSRNGTYDQSCRLVSLEAQDRFPESDANRLEPGWPFRFRVFRIDVSRSVSSGRGFRWRAASDASSTSTKRPWVSGWSVGVFRGWFDMLIKVPHQGPIWSAPALSKARQLDAFAWQQFLRRGAGGVCELHNDSSVLLVTSAGQHALAVPPGHLKGLTPPSLRSSCPSLSLRPRKPMGRCRVGAAPMVGSECGWSILVGGDARACGSVRARQLGGESVAPSVLPAVVDQHRNSTRGGHRMRIRTTADYCPRFDMPRLSWAVAVLLLGCAGLPRSRVP